MTSPAYNREEAEKKREFIVIVGQQGMGKSAWAKHYSRNNDRLFVFDPAASYPVDYEYDYDNWPDLMNVENKFRIGTYEPEDIPMFGAMAYSVGDCTFLCEEAGTIFKKGQPMDTWARRLIFMGRHVRANLIFLAQRAASIPIDIRSQADRLITFRQIEPDDVKAVTAIIGKDWAPYIPTLPPLTCLDWDVSGVENYKLKFDDKKA